MTLSKQPNPKYTQVTFREVFRHMDFYPPLVVRLLAWSLALGWLWFVFVEKDLWHRSLSGQTIIVDYIVGLPLVIALAIYFYWMPLLMVRIWQAWHLWRGIKQGDITWEQDDDE